MNSPAAIRQAVVLAAGPGRRLEPFSLTRPKCALPLANRPLVRLAVESLVEAGAEEIFIITGDDSEPLKKAVGPQPEGVRITYLRQSRPEGPIHAVLEAREHLSGQFIILCADCFVPPEMVTAAAELLGETNCTCAAAAGVCDLPLYHYQAECDNTGRLTKLKQVRIERQRTESNILTGLAVARKNVLEHMVEFAGAGAKDDWEAFFEYLIGTADVRITSCNHKFAHVDYLWEIFESDRVIKDYFFEKTASYISTTAGIADGVKIEGHHVIEDDVIIEEGSYIKDSWIGKGTHVYPKSYITRCIFGENCRIGPHCTVATTTVPTNSRILRMVECGSVVGLGRVTFGHPCHVSGVWDEGSGATACCSTSERRGVTETIIGPDGNASFRSDVIKVRTCGELISSGQDSVSCFVGRDVTLTIGVKIMPGRIIAPGSFIGPNVVVNHDVPANTYLALKQDIESRPADIIKREKHDGM
ncbi:MAG: NTP transferase domain-containing protein [Planctomycetota bacterium]|nr:NTP transferase domain-containing protein [Planctomycetota bacterium]